MRGDERESEALARTAGLFRDSSRLVWRVEGSRALDALHGLLTNDLRRPGQGCAIPCLALTAKGRPISDVRVWTLPAAAEFLLLDIAADGAEALREQFGRYLPPRFATIVPLPDASILRVLGPRALEAVRLAFGDTIVLPEQDAFVEAPPADSSALQAPESAGGPFLLHRPDTEGGGWEVLVPAHNPEVPSVLLRAVEAVGGCAVESGAWDVWRVERGIPEYGRDYGPDNLPQETGLTERVVSFDKGCYTGQEVVARIHYRGHVNQRLLGLRGPGNDPLPRGAGLFLDQRSAGSITSPVLSPRFGSIALAMIRREADPGTRLALSTGGEAEIEVVEPPFTAT